MTNEVDSGLVKNEKSKTKDSPVRVIAFLSGNWSEKMGKKKI